MSNPRRQARRELGAAAVLSESEAVALLPCRDSTAREWLRDRGIVQVTPLGRIALGESLGCRISGPGIPELSRGDHRP